jgi:hypothetical protein
MIRNANNVLHNQLGQPPIQRLVYNGIELIPLVRPLSDKPTYRWHIPGGAIMTTGELIDLAKIRNVVIKIIDYTKRPL